MRTKVRTHYNRGPPFCRRFELSVTTKCSRKKVEPMGDKVSEGARQTLSLLGSFELRSSVVSVLHRLTGDDRVHRTRSMLIRFLNLECDVKACLAPLTGCPGIAVPPGLAHLPMGRTKKLLLSICPSTIGRSLSRRVTEIRPFLREAEIIARAFMCAVSLSLSLSSSSLF